MRLIIFVFCALSGQQRFLVISSLCVSWDPQLCVYIWVYILCALMWEEVAQLLETDWLTVL